MLTPNHQKYVWSQLKQEEVFTGEGELINSEKYNGMKSAVVKKKIVEDLEQLGLAHKKVHYKMRDWSVSRQRYWGAPIPIVHCQEHGAVLVPDEQLPDTLDTYICSSWYMLRYTDPHNQETAFSHERANKWMPIDFYNGGDHATAHMLYARFVTRFFAKKGILDNPEPFKQFVFNGKVRASDGTAFSKSKGNGVDPLEIINSGYGADALRTYLMFAGPLEFNSNWDPDGVPEIGRAHV